MRYLQGTHKLYTEQQVRDLLAAAKVERNPLTIEEANQLWSQCLKNHKRPGPYELIKAFCAHGIGKDKQG